ncbi:MAG: trypsin-like serine protease [Bacteroidales bacterium]|nr:trypsin-like serine protease [Bacteroidales bacterium]
MKRNIFLLALICLFQLPGALALSDTTTVPTKIVGGTLTTITAHPWQAFITTNESFNSGAIIGSYYILTAAHGVYIDEPVPAAEIQVKIGTAQPFENDQGTVYQVLETIIHPSYDPLTGLHDIALLKLAEPVAFEGVDVIEPLADPSVPGMGAFTTIAGWGWTTYPSGEESQSLREISLPVVDIQPYQLLAGYDNSDQGVCFGDGGSPMVIDVGGTPMLAGITSGMVAECYSYGIFTKVSPYIGWIYSAIQDFTPFGDSAGCATDTAGRYACNNLGGYSYEWQLYPSEAGTIINEGYSCRVDWNPDFSGNVELSVRAGKGTADSDWYPMSVNRLPVTEFVSFPEEVQLYGHADTSLSVHVLGHNVSYQWIKDELPIPGEMDSILIITDAGSEDEGVYKVEAYGTCSAAVSDTFSVRILIPPVALPETSDLSGQLSDKTVSVYNLTGKLIYRRSNVGSLEDLDLTSLRQGMYIIHIQSGKGHFKTFKYRLL